MREKKYIFRSLRRNYHEIFETDGDEEIKYRKIEKCKIKTKL